MSKDEIALQLTLAKIGVIAYSAEQSSNTDRNAAYNEALAKAITEVYNTIYKTLEIDL